MRKGESRTSKIHCLDVPDLVENPGKKKRAKVLGERSVPRIGLTGVEFYDSRERERGVRSNMVTARVGTVSRRARAVPWKRTSEGISLAYSRIGHASNCQLNGEKQVGKDWSHSFRLEISAAAMQ